MNSFRRASFVMAALLCLIAARGGCEEGVTADKIVIGSCSALTGPNNVLGDHQVRGAKAYFAYLNDEKKGVHGRKIELKAFDDAYDPGKAVECFDQLEKEPVFAAAFFSGAAGLAKSITMAESKKIPLFGFSTGPKFAYDPVKQYIFNLRASAQDETREIVGHLWDDLGVRKIGVIYQDDAFGVGGLDGIKEALRAKGADVAVQGSFERDGKNVNDAVDRVRAANPDAVVMISVTGPTFAILKAASERGWKPIFVNIGARDSLANSKDPAALGVVAAQVMPSPSQIDLPSVALYRRCMKKYEPGFNASSYYALEGFMEAMALAEGLKRAGPDPTRDQLVSALESLSDFDMGLGPGFELHFSPQSHKGFEKGYFVVNRGGRAVLLTDWKTLRP